MEKKKDKSCFVIFPESVVMYTTIYFFKSLKSTCSIPKLNKTQKQNKSLQVIPKIISYSDNTKNNYK